MDRVCPVTRAFLRTTYNLFDLTAIYNEMWLEPYEELVERAEHAGSGRAQQHQRAFYCVELMVSVCAFRLKSAQQDLSKLSGWSRSREGLNQLLEQATFERDDLLADLTEWYYLVSRPRDERQILHATTQARAVLFKLVCESCVLLRQSLKNPEVPLRRVGRRLALAADAAQFSINDHLSFAQELIELSESRAWERKRM